MVTRDTDQTRYSAGDNADFAETLKMLTQRQIQQIDEALARSGPYAEVRLIKNRGKLRFIQRLESETVVPTGFD